MFASVFWCASRLFIGILRYADEDSNNNTIDICVQQKLPHRTLRERDVE
jgi:hypothetical protein